MPQVAAMLQKAAIQRYGIQPPPNGDYICVNGVGQLLTPDYLSEHFKTILAKNNLRRIRFHDLRHSCANLLISARVPLIEVQQWLDTAACLLQQIYMCIWSMRQKSKSSCHLADVALTKGRRTHGV